jgi:hypothetical protein
MGTALIRASDTEDAQEVSYDPDAGESSGPDRSLFVLDEIERKLATIPTVDGLLTVMAQAEALRIYARRALKGFVAQNRCAYIKLLAQRCAGQLLQEIPRAPMGGAQSGRGEKHSHTYGEWLDGLGIHPEKASRWQQLARLPDEVIKEEWETADAKGEELTEARIHAIARQRRAAEREQRWEATEPLWTAHIRDAKAADRAYTWLSKRVTEFLQDGDVSHGKLGLILADRTHVRRAAVQQLHQQFQQLLQRVEAACAALEERMDVPLTVPELEPVMSDADRAHLREQVGLIKRGRRLRQ